MKIKNNKGFMMAEVIVVSAIVVTTLTVLFMSYNKVYMIYKKRINYFDTVALYRLAYYRDILIENDVIANALDSAKSSSTAFIDIYNSGSANSMFSLPETEIESGVSDRVILAYNNKKNLNANLLDNRVSTDVSYTSFKEYITYLSTAVNLTETNYVMIIERCSNSDRSDCKYAYLEINDGFE